MTFLPRRLFALPYLQALWSFFSVGFLYLSVNWIGLYTKYLTERAQRKAFLETRRSLETRFKTQKENERQERLLLSGEQDEHFHLDFGKILCSTLHYHVSAKLRISSKFAFSFKNFSVLILILKIH